MAKRHTNGWIQGYFKPKNPEKYVGKEPIVYRSSWELKMCRMADKHPSILCWSSESVRIPYYNPILQRHSVYVPDFFLVYEDKDGKKHAEIVEIKPKKQTLLENARSKKDKLAVVLNMAKWQAAESFCKQKGIVFRVLNEDGIFNRKLRR